MTSTTSYKHISGITSQVQLFDAMWRQNPIQRYLLEERMQYEKALAKIRKTFPEWHDPKFKQLNRRSLSEILDSMGKNTLGVNENCVSYHPVDGEEWVGARIEKATLQNGKQTQDYIQKVTIGRPCFQVSYFPLNLSDETVITHHTTFREIPFSEVQEYEGKLLVRIVLTNDREITRHRRELEFYIAKT